MRRITVIGALVGVSLASAVMIQHELRPWHSNRALWARAVAPSNATIRAHVNHRTELVRAGQWEGAVNECIWLLRTVDTGQPVRPTAMDRVVIGQLCFDADHPLPSRPFSLHSSR